METCADILSQHLLGKLPWEPSRSNLDMIHHVVSATLTTLEDKLHQYLISCPDLQEISAPQDFLDQTFYTPTYNQEQPGTCAETQVDMIHTALRECHSQLTSGLNLENSNILDALISHPDHIIEEWEAESIVSKRTRKAQNEDFLRLVAGRLTVEQIQMVLIPEMKNHDQRLGEHLQEAINKAKHVHNPRPNNKCLICRLKETVEVKRIAESLFKARFITWNLFGELRNPSLSNETKWEKLQLSGRSQGLKTIISVLENHYPLLYEENKYTEITSFDCYCERLQTHQRSINTSGLSRESFRSDLSSVDNARLSDLGFQVDGVQDDLSSVDIARLSDLGSQLDGFQDELDVPMYGIRSSSSGTCLIICNYRFRDVSFEDYYIPTVQRLTEVFTKMNFKVDILENLTDKEMLEKMGKVSAWEDHAKDDYFVCFILSAPHHSEKPGCVLGVNGQEVQVKELIKSFRADSCKDFAGKPKLFFIEAGQGLNTDFPVNIPTEGIIPDEAGCLVRSIPNEADFLLAYSCPPGFHSNLSAGNNSFFLTSLADVLDKYGHEEDIMSCLLRVNTRMAAVSKGRLGQIGSQFSTLRKRVLFVQENNLMFPT